MVVASSTPSTALAISRSATVAVSVGLGLQHQLVAERLELVVHGRDDVRIELVVQVGQQQADPPGSAAGQRPPGLAGHIAQRLGRLAHPGLVSSLTFGLSRSARETVGWETPASLATSWLVTTMLMPFLLSSAAPRGRAQHSGRLTAS